MGKSISFQSYYGSSVENGLDEVSQGRLIKNNIYGTGFRNGKPVSIGCAKKGKIWSKDRRDIASFKNWCRTIGSLIQDKSINPNTVLTNSLVPTITKRLPNVEPIAMDWDEIPTVESVSLLINERPVFLDECELLISDQTIKGENIVFQLNLSLIHISEPTRH